MPKKARGLTLPLDDLISEAQEQAEKEKNRRGYVGLSQIAHECERALWYNFRWATPKHFPGRILRRFETGHVMEDRVIAWLKSAGFEVLHINPKARNEAKQFAGELYGGAARGHLDGFVRGDVTIGDTRITLDEWHLLEVKALASAKYYYNDNETYDYPTANKHPIEHPTKKGNPSNIEGRWFKLKRQGVQTAQKVHYGQMQAYMGLSQEIRPNSELKCANCNGTGQLITEHPVMGIGEDGNPKQLYMASQARKCTLCNGTGKLGLRRWHETWGIENPLTKALYIGVNTDTDQIYAEQIEFEPAWFKAAKQRALRIIRNQHNPPDRIKETPVFPPCSLCEHAGICHLNHAMAKNCRTCKHAEVKLPNDRGYFGKRAQWFCNKHKQGCGDYTACDSYQAIQEPITF